MTRLVRDARFAFRLFTRSPAFTSVAVVVLALGIGSTTAIFSVVYGTFFAPLPYRDAEALVNMVTPQFFETFGIRILRGRPFTEQDRAGSVRVAIVNETFVRLYLPDLDPLTARVRMRPYTYGAQSRETRSWRCAIRRNLYQGSGSNVPR